MGVVWPRLLQVLLQRAIIKNDKCHFSFGEDNKPQAAHQTIFNRCAKMEPTILHKHMTP